MLKQINLIIGATFLGAGMFVVATSVVEPVFAITCNPSDWVADYECTSPYTTWDYDPPPLGNCIKPQGMPCGELNQSCRGSAYETAHGGRCKQTEHSESEHIVCRETAAPTIVEITKKTKGCYDSTQYPCGCYWLVANPPVTKEVEVCTCENSQP